MFSRFAVVVVLGVAGLSIPQPVSAACRLSAGPTLVGEKSGNPEQETFGYACGEFGSPTTTSALAGRGNQVARVGPDFAETEKETIGFVSVAPAR